MQQTQAHIYGGIGGNGGAAGGQGGAGGAGQGPTTNFGGLQFVVQSNNQPDAQRLLTIDTSPTGGGCLTGGASSQPCVSSPAASTSVSEPNTPRASYSRSATYCRHLLGQGRGFPLYVPGPQSNLPREYRTTGVSIGDAGRVTPEGIFDFLFNIFLPRDHPVNARAPHDFTPLAPYDPSDLCTVDFAPGDHVSGLSATETSNEAMGFPGGDFIFTCFDPDGAILCLPHGAHLVRLQDVEAIRRYAAKNAESWYQYANVVRGRGIVNGELYLITGCEKASSWGIATFHGVPLQTTFSLSFRPTRDERPGFRYRWQGPHSHRKQVDTSPADGTPPNQTVFIHAFTISVAERIWEKLFGVEVRQLVDSSTLLDKLGRPFVPYGSSGSSFFQSSFFGVFGGGKQNGQGPALCDGLVADASPVSKISHPSHIIHSCILRKAPEATVVITHDDDWRDFLKADYMRKSAQRWEEALFDHLEIMVQDGMAFLKDKSTSKRGATTMTAETIRDCPVSSPDDLPSLLPHSNRRSESGGERSANISLSSMPQSPAGIGPDLQDRSQDFLFPGGMPSSRSCSQFSLLTGVQVPVPTPGLDDSILALNNRSRSDSDLSTQCKDIRSGSSLPKEEGSDGALRLRHAHHSDDEHVGTDSTEISHRSFGRPHKPGLLRSASVRATTSANTYLKSIGSQQGRRTPMTEPPIPPATASWVIRPDELENVAHLSGLIAQGRWRNTVVILKVLSKQVEPSSLHQRGELWTSLRHPNVLQMFGVSPLDADPLYVVTQFQPDGNVMRFLERNPNVDRAKIVYDIVLGMQYLHARGVVHGSLKPNNILVGDGRACISDYGMVEVHPSGSYGHRYFSPEAWKGTVSRSSDVFAWAMCALEIFTSKAPWGILTEKQIFNLVVRQDIRPDRPDEDFGLIDHIWCVMEECWHRESRLRPTFDILVQLLGPGDSLASLHSQRSRHAPSMTTHISGPPAYEIMATNLHPDSGPSAMLEFTPQSTFSKRPLTDFTPVRLDRTPDRSEAPSNPTNFSPLPPRQYSHEESDTPSIPHPGSAPPAGFQYPASSIPLPRRNSSDLLHPRRQYTHDGSDASTASSPNDGFDEGGLSPMFNNSLSLRSPETPNTPWSTDRQLPPFPSAHTSSSGGSPRSQNSASRGAAPNRLRNIGPIWEELGAANPRNLRSSPSPAPHDHSKWLNPETAYLKHMPSTSTFPTASTFTFPTEYNSSATSFVNTYAESIRSQQGRTALNATLLAGALLTEVKEGRKRDIIDGYLDKVQRLGLQSHKDAQKLVTAGVIPSLILLLKTRAVDGIGLETVLLALGILAHDPITGNTIYRTGTSATLIEIIDAALSDDMAALAIWCLARICRSAEIATELIKLNLGRLLVTKGLKGGQRTSRMSAWCLGILIRSDSIADALADIGLANALCEHLRRCFESINAGPEDYSATVYAVARLSRSIKISKALAKGGCVGILSHFLMTAEDPQVLLWTARAIGCLMRPNSSDIAKVLLDAGVARGLARLPSMLPTEEVEPLGSFAFAIQRFSCVEWGSGTRNALVDAGVVDALLAAFRTAADEPYPQVHIDLAYAIALLSDVGGAPIRKQIVNAGGIDILKRIAGSTGRPDVAKACNVAATSINGNLWSRNTASAKAAMAHEWSGGCPDHFPESPVPLNDLQSESKDDW